MKKIAYLAPEIPALSATFVYNEILALEKLGYSVKAFSIHIPKKIASEKEIDSLRQNTVYLYNIGFLKAFYLFIIQFFTSVNAIFTLFICLMDFFEGLKSDSFSAEKKIKINLMERLRTSLKLFYHYYYGVILSKLLLEANVKHLHIHFAHVPTQIGMYASLIANIPFTFTSHANDIFERGFLLKTKIKRSRNACTISEFNKSYLIKNGGDSSKIKIIRCGVDTNLKIDISQKTNKKEFRIGSLGRLVEKKGMDSLILAFQKMQNENIKLIIAGDGPLAPDLTLLASKTPNLQIEFPGSISHDKVNEWISSLDLFVLACKEDKNGDKDGIPVVLIEAMNLKIPVVSTNISALGELIENGYSGFLGEPNNVDSIKSCIEKVIHLQESEKEKILENAKQKIIKEFDLYVNTKRLTENFHE